MVISKSIMKVFLMFKTSDYISQAEGGSKTYMYNVSDSELATIDSEGHVVTHGGPGEFDVKAYMPKSPNNFWESRVRICLLLKTEVFSLLFYKL